MFKTNKKNILKFELKNKTPLLSSNSKGKKISKNIKIKKIQDINGMQITYGIIWKKS